MKYQGPRYVLTTEFGRPDNPQSIDALEDFWERSKHAITVDGRLALVSRGREHVVCLIDVVRELLTSRNDLRRRVEALELLAPYAGHSAACASCFGESTGAFRCICGFDAARAKADALMADYSFTKSPSSSRFADSGPHSGGGERGGAETASAASSGNRGNCGTPEQTAALARDPVSGGAAPIPDSNSDRSGPRTDDKRKRAEEHMQRIGSPGSAVLAAPADEGDLLATLTRVRDELAREGYADDPARLIRELDGADDADRGEHAWIPMNEAAEKTAAKYGGPKMIDVIAREIAAERNDFAKKLDAIQAALGIDDDADPVQAIRRLQEAIGRPGSAVLAAPADEGDLLATLTHVHDELAREGYADNPARLIRELDADPQPTTPRIAASDLAVLLVCTTRYALGRSGSLNTTIEAVLQRYASSVAAATRDSIRCDIEFANAQTAPRWREVYSGLADNSAGEPGGDAP